MKILVAYDGSKCSDAALDDLARAGLPETGEAIVISVAETWRPRGGAALVEHGIDTPPEAKARFHAETEAIACHGKKRVQHFLPGWTVDSAAVCGSPGRQILAKADEFAADLIIVGSQGRSAIGRFVLGSISQKVLAEARCSVRVGRGRIEIDETPVRIMIAFDGSEGSFDALRAAAARRWPAGSEIRVISAANPIAPGGIDRFVTPAARIVNEVDPSEEIWLKNRAAEAAAILEPAGLRVDFEIIPGSAKHVLVEEAARWDADCIFVGPGRMSRAERIVFGSTSAAVAARASSSVEAVRAV